MSYSVEWKGLKLVLDRPALDQHFGFQQRVKDLVCADSRIGATAMGCAKNSTETQERHQTTVL